VTPWRPRHNPWAIALTVTLATFMEVLDTSIANVALPHIAGNLSVGEDAATWILTSYLVSNAIVLPISGWLSGVVGRKRFYMTCVTLFTVSSLLCGLAPSLGWLIFLRVLQGAGGGGLAPSEQAILADTFPEEKRGMAFAVYGMAVVLAPAIGPTLGGFITDTVSWRWIFFINVPVGILSLILSSRLLEDPPHARAQKTGGVDYMGLGLIVIGVGCLQILLDKGEREDWFSSHLIVFLTVVSAASLVAAVIWEWRHKDPIIELRLLRARNFATGNVLMFVLGFVLYGSTVLLPQFLQTLMGYSATQAGETLSPGGLVVLVCMPLVGVLITRVDARWMIAFGMAATAAALWYMTGISLEIDFRTAVEYRMLQSVGLAFLFVPINTVAYVGVPPEKSNQVSAILNLSRNLGGSFGISILTTLIFRRAQLHQVRLAAHATPFDRPVRQTVAGMARQLAAHGIAPADATRRAWALVQTALSRQAQTLAYVDVLALLAAICGVMVLSVFLMKKSRRGAAVMH
jgi:MFS transporter, DHA2 family, multidrug resistance protein